MELVQRENGMGSRMQVEDFMEVVILDRLAGDMGEIYTEER